MHHQAHALLVVWDGSRIHKDESSLPLWAATYKKKKKEDHIIKLTEYHP